MPPALLEYISHRLEALPDVAGSDSEQTEPDSLEAPS